MASSAGCGTVSVNNSTFREHSAVKSGIVTLKFAELPNIDAETLETCFLVAAISKKKAIFKWSHTFKELLYKTCFPLSSQFYTFLLSKQIKSQRHSSPIYCAQMFDVLNSEESIVDHAHSHLDELLRKLTSDLIDAYIGGLRLSRSISAVVSIWKSQIGKLYQEWKLAEHQQSPFVVFNDPTEVIKSVIEETSVEQTPNVYQLTKDFVDVINAITFWNLTDQITSLWSNYLQIIETGNEDIASGKEAEILQLFACLLPFSLLFTNSQSGKSPCFDVIVRLVIHFQPCARLAKFLGHLAGVLVHTLGENSYDEFINPRIEIVLDSWKGQSDKESDESLIFIYATQLKNTKIYFNEIKKNIKGDFLTVYTSLLLTSKPLLPFINHLLSVRLCRPKTSQKHSAMLVPDCWSEIIKEILSGRSGKQPLTSKALVTQCLEPFWNNYVDNQYFKGESSAGSVGSLFQHTSSIIRESSVWKAGAGGRTIAELEKRRGDSNMAEFYQLMRAADYPEFVDEMVQICNYIGKRKVNIFSQPENGSKSRKDKNDETVLNPNLLIHVLWMREVRSHQSDQNAIDVSGLLPSYLQDCDEEQGVVQQPQQAEEEMSEESEDSEPPADLATFWQRLKPNHPVDSTSSSTVSADLSSIPSKLGGFLNLQGPPLPNSKVTKAFKGETSRVEIKDEGTRQVVSPEVAISPTQQIADSISLILQQQLASTEAILTNFSHQQQELVTEMVAMVGRTRSSNKKKNGKDDPSSSSSSSDQPKGSTSNSSSSIMMLEQGPKKKDRHGKQEQYFKLPMLLNLACPNGAQRSNLQPGEQVLKKSRENELPMLLTLNDSSGGGGEFYNQENMMTEKRMINIVQAASHVCDDSTITRTIRSINHPGLTDQVPPLIGVGMLKKFRVRKTGPRSHSQTNANFPTTERRKSTIGHTEVINTIETTQSRRQIYTSTTGVNTETLRMISVGVTAAVKPNAPKTLSVDPGVIDDILKQSEAAIEKRREEFEGSSYIGADALKLEDEKVADIGLLNYFKRRPMPAFIAPPMIISEPKQKPQLVSKATGTEGGVVDEKVTPELSSHLKLVNPEAFAIIENQMGLNTDPNLIAEFLSVREMTKQGDQVPKNVEQAEAELERLLKNARKTIGFQSFQRNEITQTGESPPIAPQDYEHIPQFNAGFDLVAKEDDDNVSETAAELDARWSKKLDELDAASVKVQSDFAKIRQVSDELLKTMESYEDEESPEEDLFGNAEVPPIFKKSVSFSESLMETPRQIPNEPLPSARKPKEKKSSSSPTTPSTPHLDVVQLIDTGSLKPKSVAAGRTPRTPRVAHGDKHLMSNVQLSASVNSSTSTTTPSEMKSTKESWKQLQEKEKKIKMPAVSDQMDKRLDSAKELLDELQSEQRKLRDRSSERWSDAELVRSKQMTRQKQRTGLSDTEKRDAQLIHSQFRRALLTNSTSGKRKRPETKQDEHLNWLLEKEAEYAKPPSDTNSDKAQSEVDVRELDPAVADLMEKYSVHSGSVYSIVDWGAVDQLAQQTSQDV